MDDASRGQTPAPTYTAFISYRHGGADGRWARWLHRRLERYRPPAPFAAGWRGRRVFRDEEELAASADLSAALRAALEASDALIVVCSPRTPASRWVAEEVALFRAWGRGDRIFPVLIAGDPAASFPPPLRADGVPEPLAADARGGRPADVLLRVAAGLLGVPFDDLRRREDERRRRRLAWLTAGAAALAAVFLGLAVVAFVQADLAERRRVRAETAERDEREQRGVAEERLARSLLDRGLVDAAGGRTAAGLHGLARAAELARPGSPLAAEADALLADWGRTLGFPVRTGEATVTCAALSADGRTAAVGDERGRVTLWRLAPGRPPVHAGTLEHGDGRVMAVTFSPSGEMLAVSEFYAHVSVWDVPKVRRLALLRPTNSRVLATYDKVAFPATAAFHPDEEAIALSWSPQGGGVLQIYRLPSGEPVGNAESYKHGVAAFRFTAHSARVFSVDFAGNRFQTPPAGGAFDIRPDTPTGTSDKFAEVTLGPGPLKDARYLRRFFDISGVEGIELRRAEDGALVCPPWPELDTTDAAFSQDGRRLATVHGAAVRVWDAATGAALRPLITSPARVTAVGWAANRHQLAVGDDAGTVTVWQIDGGERNGVLPVHRWLGLPQRLGGRVTQVAFHPSAPWLLAAAVGEVRWWSWESLHPADGGVHTEVYARGPGGRRVYKLGRALEAVGPDGQAELLGGGSVGAVGFLSADRLAGMDFNNRVLLWDAADGKLLAEAKTAALALRVLAVSPETGEMAVAEAKTGVVRRWTVAGDRLEPLPFESNAKRPQVRGLTYADGGQRLVVLSDRAEVLTPDGRLVATVPVREYVSGWALSPDGRTLAVAGNRTPPLLIFARDGRVVREFACDAVVRELAFSPDGAVLAGVTTAEFRSRPPQLSRWWAATGSRLPDLPVPTEGVYGLGYDPDGRLTLGGLT